VSICVSAAAFAIVIGAGLALGCGASGGLGVRPDSLPTTGKETLSIPGRDEKQSRT